MSNSVIKYEIPKNEPIFSYAPKSRERELLKEELKRRKQIIYDIPQYINGKEIRTNDIIPIFPPYDLQHQIGFYHKGSVQHVTEAINACLQARKTWATLSFERRAAIFLKAADLISTKYRYAINAATILGQSKNVFQAEIDAVCEFADFLRFNVYYAAQIYQEQPTSEFGVKNYVEYRALEGFVYAATPFNFTAIAANLVAAPALMGNVVVWKPSPYQIYSAWTIMEILREAGLPNGVVNLIFTDPIETSEIIFSHKEFAAFHFTGSTFVLQQSWKRIAQHIEHYKTYPKIVGETGGKDFILAHASANSNAVTTAILRASFEFQGQKCSACSRAYLPKSKWDEIWEIMYQSLKTFKIGTPEDFSTFMGAVISEDAFNRIVAYIEHAKQNPDNIIMFGGHYDKSKGYFIEPTVILSKDPYSKTMVEEIFGPVLTIYLYDDDQFSSVINIIDNTSDYALTGAVFAKDAEVINFVRDRLQDNAGNFYINDKCTGAVVGQQPFGGARKSGTNDKAGSKFHLLRFVSPRTVKENYLPPTYYAYSYMYED